MLKTGWLVSEEGISPKGRPVRIFKVTKAGLKHLEAELSSFKTMFIGIHRVLAVAKS